jgi:hypothetical protein
MSAFEVFYASLKHPGILLGRLQQNPYTTTVLDRRLRYLDKSYHKIGEKKLALPREAAAYEWDIVADELVTQFRTCLVSVSAVLDEHSLTRSRTGVPQAGTSYGYPALS